MDLLPTNWGHGEKLRLTGATGGLFRTPLKLPSSVALRINLKSSIFNDAKEELQ